MHICRWCKHEGYINNVYILYLRHQPGSHQPIPVYMLAFDENLGEVSMPGMVSETGHTRERGCVCVLLSSVLCSVGIDFRPSGVGIVLIVDTSIYNLIAE